MNADSERSASSPSPDRHFALAHPPPPDQGLSLDELSQAFAGMLGSGDDPYAEPAPEENEDEAALIEALGPAAKSELPSVRREPSADDACEVTPRSILEAMLFVGNRDNTPLSSQRIAGMMRGVRAAEIDELVNELNQRYDANGCPYRIYSEADGYRLMLRDEFNRIRDKFYGRMRQARLSPAAIEVLSIIAYQGAQTSEEVNRLRGTPSGAILSQLVRRQLLRIERDPAAPRSPRYHTTARFLELFGLESLDDLPRSQEIERR
ncbi:MAG TPA: SMC-Scp complex subunit ScpB [Pirellulales bacterium]|nr:SMC-Scp complex subunit ScpB [Pirellulales bacterium]